MSTNHTNANVHRGMRAEEPESRRAHLDGGIEARISAAKMPRGSTNVHERQPHRSP